MLSNLFSFLSGPTQYENLSGQDFAERVKNDPKAVVVDVRSVMEFKSGRLPGAKNIDVSDPRFLEKFEALGKDKHFYLYCRSGARSASACSLLARHGFENLVNMSGGVMMYRGKLV